MRPPAPFIFIAVWITWLSCLAEVGQVEKGVVTSEQERYAVRPGAAQFVPPSKTFAWQMVVIEQHPLYTTHLLTFPSPLESPFPCNNTVYAEYFRPHMAQKFPAVIVLHIAGGDFDLSRLISRQLAMKGIGALFLQMAYYGYRRSPDKNSARMLSEDVARTHEAVRQTVTDIRRAGLWLSLRPEVDPQKIGILGPSLGALVGCLAAGVDPRFTRSAFILGGGDLAKIIWESTLTAKTKKTMMANGLTFESLEEKIKSVDPLAYAGNIDPKGVLMVNARYDTVVPVECTMRLWKAMGQPQILWYDTDHVQMLGYLFEVMDKVCAHFAAERW